MTTYMRDVRTTHLPPGPVVLTIARSGEAALIWEEAVGSPDVTVTAIAARVYAELDFDEKQVSLLAWTLDWLLTGEQVRAALTELFVLDLARPGDIECPGDPDTVILNYPRRHPRP